MKNIKVFQIELKPHESFTYYNRNGIITNINDLEHPYPIHPSHIWDSSTENYLIAPVNGKWFRQLVIPTVVVSLNDLSGWIKFHTLDLVKTDISYHHNQNTYITGAGFIIDGNEINLERDRNIFIFTKDIESNMLAAGMSFMHGEAEHRNLPVESMVNRYLQLKAFW